MSGKAGRSGPPGHRHNFTHGLNYYKRLLSNDGLKHSTALYRALVEKERELVEALGGDPSPQERAIIGDTVKTMLFIGSIDRYLFGLKSIVRKGRIHAVLPERTRLATHLRENLKTLGLKRMSKDLSLSDYIADQYGNRDPEQPEDSETGSDAVHGIKNEQTGSGEGSGSHE